MPDEIDLARRGLFRGRLRTAEPPVQLPWSVNWSAFVADCTRCGDCLAACPEQILVNGEGGFPVVDFQRGECTFCTECVTVCKVPLFRPTSESPGTTRPISRPTVWPMVRCSASAVRTAASPMPFVLFRCWGVCPPRRSSRIAVVAAAPACRIVRLAASRSTGEPPHPVVRASPPSSRSQNESEAVWHRSHNGSGVPCIESGGADPAPLRHQLAEQIGALEGAEIHAVSDEGKLVVTLEGRASGRSWRPLMRYRRCRVCSLPP